MRSRYDNQIGPTTIKRCRYRRQYRKKNRTRAQIKNGNYKRKNATTRKKYKGGFFKYLKEKYASYKARREEALRQQEADSERLLGNRNYKTYRDRRDAGMSENESYQLLLQDYQREAARRVAAGAGAASAVPAAALSRSATNLSWKDRWNGIRQKFTRKQPNVPHTTPPPLSHHDLTHQLQQELRDEANQLAASKRLIRLMAQREDALAVQMPPPYMFSNIDSITFRSNYQRSQQSVDEWNAFKDAVLMPTWNAQVGHMKAHVEFMNRCNNSADFAKSEAMLWDVVCDTEIVRNVLIHSICKFTCAESIGTCLAFQRFLFPFSTDIVSELYKKRFPLEFDNLNLSAATTTTETMLKSDIVVIKNFAENLLLSIMLQMSRDDYYCTYELNAKRELLLRLVICMVKRNNEQLTCEIIAHFYEGIFILFGVDDNKSKHYDEFQTITASLIKLMMGKDKTIPANLLKLKIGKENVLKYFQECNHKYDKEYIQDCRAVAEKYSKRLKFSRAAEIVGLPVRTNSVQQEPSPHTHIPSAIIKKANATECNSTTSIHDLESLCKDGNLCHSLGSLTNKGSKYYVYPQNKLCDPLTGQLADNTTVFGVTKTEKEV